MRGHLAISKVAKGEKRLNPLRSRYFRTAEYIADELRSFVTDDFLHRSTLNGALKWASGQIPPTVSNLICNPNVRD
jgi:hypothetical protein